MASSDDDSVNEEWTWGQDNNPSKESMAAEIKQRQAVYEEMIGTMRFLKDELQDKEDALHVAEEQLVKRASAIVSLDATNKRQKLDLDHYKSMISTRGITGNKGETIKRKDMFDSKSGCFRRWLLLRICFCCSSYCSTN